MDALRIAHVKRQLDMGIGVGRVSSPTIDRFWTTGFDRYHVSRDYGGMIMAACDGLQRVTSLPGVRTDAKEISGLTFVRNGVTVRFLKRLRAINACLVVLPSTGQPSKLPGACPKEVGTRRIAANNVNSMLSVSLCHTSVAMDVSLRG